METTAAKNKTLVTITKEVADRITSTFGHAAIGLTGADGFTTYQYRLDDLKDIEEAQKELDEAMDRFFSNPSNADGGSPDDRYRVLLNVARRFDVDEQFLNN